MYTETYRYIKPDNESVVADAEKRTTRDGRHAVAAGAHEVVAWTDGRAAHSIALGRTPGWITPDQPSSEGADETDREPSLYARTTGDDAAAVAIGRAVTAESSGRCSPAVALDTTTYERDAVAAITYDGSPALAYGRPDSDVRVTADTVGSYASAVAIGGDAHALTSDVESHAVVLANSFLWRHFGQTAEASGRWAYAIAPTGTAHSREHISIGLRVVLETADSVGVLLPRPYTDLRPVIVDGRSHPTKVALTLNEQGEVVVAE